MAGPTGPHDNRQPLSTTGLPARHELCVDGLDRRVKCPDHPCPARDHRRLRLPEKVQVICQATKVELHLVPALEQALALTPQTPCRRRERLGHIEARGLTARAG
jgi:hypothetical protein